MQTSKRRRGIKSAGAFTLILALSVAVVSQSNRGNALAAPQAPDRPIPFHSGEVLTYDISWANTLSAGTATFSVKGTRPVEGNRTAYDIVAEARPGFIIGTLYTIYYKLESSIDSKTALPVQATMYSEEGSRKRTRTTKFVGPTTIEYEYKAATTSRTTKTVEKQTYDPLSLFYAVRTMPLTTGQTLTIPVTEGGYNYRIRVQVGGYEQISTGAGKFRALRLTPSIVDEKGKAVTDRKLTLWISDDARHLPVRFQSVLLVGSFVLDLSRVSG
jgi:hypothetical protein